MKTLFNQINMKNKQEKIEEIELMIELSQWEVSVWSNIGYIIWCQNIINELRSMLYTAYELGVKSNK